MTTEASPKRGDIVLVSFPYTDLSTHKRRPALMLTDPDRDGDFVAAAITSKAGHEASVALENEHLSQGRLAVASWIRADKLFTLQRTVVARRIGCVRPEVMRSTLAVLCPALGCR